LDESSWEQKLLEDQDAASWMPPGDLIENYAVKGRNYEIWRAELTEPATRALLERMQILVSFFIEGGMPLQLQDQDWTLARWCVFFV
jgi:histone acetyltransferase 1